MKLMPQLAAAVLVGSITLLGACSSPQRHVSSTPPPPQPQPIAPAPVAPAPLEPAPVASVPTPETNTEPSLQLRDFLPHIRIDAAHRVAEFDATVPIDAHDPSAPRVYLEVLACSRDSREHEALAVTDARPSQVHAALLAIGLEPGKPGSYSWQGQQVQATPPTGPRVRVVVVDATGAERPMSDWAIDVQTNRTLTQTLAADAHAFVFAGSVSVEKGNTASYLADGAGTLVGLATFGTETIACESMFNHDSGVEEPHWIANAALVPKAGTPVRVRLIAE